MAACIICSIDFLQRRYLMADICFCCCPRAFCDRFSKTQTCAFFLRAFSDTGYLAVTSHGAAGVFRTQKMGILCILYGVDLTCNCMSSAIWSVEADCLRIGASCFISLSILIIFLGPRGIGRCRRWKNGYTYELSGSNWEGKKRTNGPEMATRREVLLSNEKCFQLYILACNDLSRIPVYVGCRVNSLISKEHIK